MGGINYSKADYDFMSAKRLGAFVKIARVLGKKHPVVTLMGPLAWGRHHFEQGPDGNLRTAIREMSALDGMFHVLNVWARYNDPKAQAVLLKHYPQGFESVRR